jgi:hypothetical protein
VSQAEPLDIVGSVYEFARLIFYDMTVENVAPAETPATTDNAGRKGPTNGNTNGKREGAKPPGHVPESRAKVEDVGHDFSRQWGEIAGFCDLVRQFLRAASARWSLTAGV